MPQEYPALENLDRTSPLDRIDQGQSISKTIKKQYRKDNPMYKKTQIPSQARKKVYASERKKKKKNPYKKKMRPARY